MEQQEITRPFGTEGMRLDVRIENYRWVVALYDNVGPHWVEYERLVARSSADALRYASILLESYTIDCRAEW